MFIFEGGRVQMGERQRERETESEAGSRLWAVSTEPHAELQLTSTEIMTWDEVRCPTDWAIQAPREYGLLKKPKSYL